MLTLLAAAAEAPSLGSASFYGLAVAAVGVLGAVAVEWIRARKPEPPKSEEKPVGQAVVEALRAFVLSHTGTIRVDAIEALTALVRHADEIDLLIRGGDRLDRQPLDVRLQRIEEQLAEIYAYVLDEPTSPGSLRTRKRP